MDIDDEDDVVQPSYTEYGVGAQRWVAGMPLDYAGIAEFLADYSVRSLPGVLAVGDAEQGRKEIRNINYMATRRPFADYVFDYYPKARTT